MSAPAQAKPHHPFVVFSLPRSRSAWSSIFLSYGGLSCGHDIGIECASPEDFVEAMTGKLAGTCETGAMFAWRLIREYLPTVKFVTVRRPRADVIASLERFGLTGFEGEMERRDTFLDEIAALPGTLNLSFDDLASADGCRKMFEFCLERPLDLDWWSHLQAIDIQVDMQKCLGRLAANRSKIDALKADVARRQSRMSGGGECRAA